MREFKDGDKIVHLPQDEQRPVAAVRHDGYQCDCHKKMGNDFWFLPIKSCLRDDNTCSNKERTQ